MKTHLQYISLSLLLLSSLGISGCLDESYFGLYDAKKILALTLEGQSGNANIDADSLTVVVGLSQEQDLKTVTILDLQISSLAQVSPAQGDIVDFSDPVTFTVTAEDGSKADWTVTAERQGDKPQLPNSDFNTWYESSGGYMEPGESADNTLWATGNAGVVTLADPNTTPFDLGDGNNAAYMETLSIPSILGSPPLAAGSIFIGEFVLNIADPASSAIFGQPFTARPSGFKVMYQYEPGSQNQDAQGDPISYSDQCYIWLTLEKRDGSQISRVASGWFRSESTTTDWTNLEIDLVYGELDASAPDYIKIKPGETYADPSETPSHISVVFTSSADGDIFEGAPGSKLIVDDFELIY